MSRNVLVKLVFVVLFWGLSYSVGCGDPKPQPEETTKDATVVETRPEPPPVREAIPEGKQQPKGVGTECRIGPGGGQGTCPNAQLLCGSVSSTKSICFENCSSDNKCALPTERCVTVREMSRFPVCVKVGKSGDKCGLEQRVICPGELSEPALFCVNGTCQERPKDGWDVGQACTRPRGDDQSDCKAGLLCVEHAKNVFQCAKSCTSNSDCPSGETCDTAGTYLPKKVCVIEVKAGGKCDKLKRRFCKTENPLNPVQCKTGVCKPKTQLQQLGDTCIKSSLPGEERGNCDQGLVCLGVSDRESRCYKACQSNSDCPANEACVTHPNLGPGDPLKACVIEVPEKGECDLVQRKMCKQQPNQFYKCKRPDDKTTKGVCTPVNIGDACINHNDCGRMACVQIDPQNNPTKKYCLVPCDPKAPKCPSNGACQQWGGQNGPFACVPTGPKKNDEPCTALQAVGDKLNTSSLCIGGLVCVTFQKGNPAGVCMKNVPGCTATSCDNAHVCLPVSKTSAFCGLDCSKGANVCKPGTKCLDIKQLKAKVCGPTL